MRISWKRVAILAGVVVLLLVASGPTNATKPYKQYVVKCNPNQCTPEEYCGAPAAPKVCGETKDGPYFVATYYCCCCTADSKGHWFFGE